MAKCFSLSFPQSSENQSQPKCVWRALCTKTIFDMIEHFSTLFNTEMTEDLRKIARGQGSQAISLRHKLD